MSHIHLIIEKRSQIDILRKEGYSVCRIPNLIGVHYSTVVRESNCFSKEYSAIEEQKIAFVKSANKGRSLKLIVQFAAYIESRLQQSWPPEQ